MRRMFKNDPLIPLLEEYQRTVQEANLLAIINKKMAEKRIERAQCVALQIMALRFVN